MSRKVLEVRPNGPGEVVKWSSFRQGLFESMSNVSRFTRLTTCLTDAVSTMWKICVEMDPSCERVVHKANGLFSTYFRLAFIGTDFCVEAERSLAYGLNPELSSNYRVLLTVTSESAELVEAIIERYVQLVPDPLRIAGGQTVPK
ncbi:MAG: hypothetical protein QGF00_33060 [Planctomycetota bacterium]|nr:hypothetical protein [Planctomycetota bacterium]MDP7254472.1 hypothetical protein [Planctomycetota bacterium]